MAIWLMKSEPDEFSINDLKQNTREYWNGVRNFQARNFMRQMREGDLVLFYHSSCKTPGIVGTAYISKEAHPDPSCWDTQSVYFDPKSSPDAPRWDQVQIRFDNKLKKTLTLTTLKSLAELNGFPLVAKGNRLSVMPVEDKYWKVIQPILEIDATDSH